MVKGCERFGDRSSMFFDVDQSGRIWALRVQPLDGELCEIDCDLGFVC